MVDREHLSIECMTVEGVIDSREEPRGVGKEDLGRMRCRQGEGNVCGRGGRWVWDGGLSVKLRADMSGRTWRLVSPLGVGNCFGTLHCINKQHQSLSAPVRGPEGSFGVKTPISSAKTRFTAESQYLIGLYKEQQQL